MKTIIFFLLLLPLTGSAQDYVSYFTGNTTDTATAAGGGICLMGGASEDDEAMKWFLNKANSGDILVLRASGSDGYNNYLYSQLGITVNSVETIVFNNGNASYDPYVHSRIMLAEAIWFAGGDQWNYISYWINTPVDSLINAAIADRNIVVGGTSAGMAIMGKYYFTAQNGTVTSSAALADPYSSTLTIDSSAFLENAILHNVITDTHFDNPDRKGRTVTFLARALTDDGFPLKAIACDEYTAVCIEPDGTAKVYGGYPAYDDKAYLIQPNCELNNFIPENCTAGNPLTWNHSGEAMKVYKVKGTATGINTFNLNDWSTGSGGQWENWGIVSGVLSEVSDDQIDCSLSSGANDPTGKTTIFPVPVSDLITITTDQELRRIEIMDLSGRVIFSAGASGYLYTVPLHQFPEGAYLISIQTAGGTSMSKILKIK